MLRFSNALLWALAFLLGFLILCSGLVRQRQIYVPYSTFLEMILRTKLANLLPGDPLPVGGDLV